MCSDSVGGVATGGAEGQLWRRGRAATGSGEGQRRAAWRGSNGGGEGRQRGGAATAEGVGWESELGFEEEEWGWRGKIQKKCPPQFPHLSENFQYAAKFRTDLDMPPNFHYPYPLRKSGKCTSTLFD